MEETSSSSNQWKKHFANSSSLKTACHLNHACISSPFSTGGNYTPIPSSKWKYVTEGRDESMTNAIQ